MDPFSLSVLSGVIANALTAFASQVGREIEDPSKVGLEWTKVFREDRELETILQKATASIARDKSIEKLKDADKIRLFLVSPEVEAIVRQIYADQLKKPSQSLKLIRNEFLASLSLRLKGDEESICNVGNSLFDTLLQGCERAFKISLDRGILSVHEGKSLIRHRMLLDELETIQRNLDLLTGPQTPRIEEISEFEETYRQQVASRHKDIIPPHFDVARRISIDELYVCPDFIEPPKKAQPKEHRLVMTDFISRVYRAVILGDPGGGKSTFALKMCHDLAQQYPERTFAGRQATPILVVLREYGADKKVNKCSIVDFMETTANSKYQIKPPTNAFEYMLLNGRTVVIFDGLDELLDTSYRQEISADVESFCTLYPSVPVLVTSRRVGYEQAPLDPKRFETYLLAPLGTEQVAEYVQKWFKADSDLTEGQQKQKSEAFLKESEIVPDLRSNPLMLALMCNIYRGENYIPKNRPDVYEKCALMLFERWDKSRGILLPLPFESHIRPAMMFIAHWIYSREALQGGVTEKKLVAQATDYLCPRRFEKLEEAEQAAREFIDFCRGRAWVFTDAGTTKEGERLYHFTHRTFLEYFTAAHLVRTHPTPDKLWTVLVAKIASGEWDVVAQLAFQIQNKNVEGAGDELLKNLVDRSRYSKGSEKLNFISFSVRCLEFIVPTPKVVRDIVTALIEVSLSSEIAEKRHSPEGRSPRRVIQDMFEYITYASTENRPTIADCVEKRLVEIISSNAQREAAVGLEIAHSLVVHGGTKRSMQTEVYEFWSDVSKRICERCFVRDQDLSRNYLSTCLRNFWNGSVTLQQILEWHGPAAIFAEEENLLFTFYYAPIAAATLYQVLHAPRSENVDSKYVAILRDVASLLPLYPTPWIRTPPGRIPPLMIHYEDTLWKGGPSSLKLDSNALFGAFLLFAPYLESSASERGASERIESAAGQIHGLMRNIFLARFKKTETATIEIELATCGFSPEQRVVVGNWIDKRTSYAVSFR